MADAAPAPVVAKSPKKKAAAKPKKPAAHPKYSDMIRQAITGLKERGGSSRQAILKYIMKNFNVGKDEKTVNSHLKLSLRAAIKNGSLKQNKGSGASGSFSIGKKAEKPKKPKKVKKPKAAKPKKAKKPKAAKKPKSAAKPKKVKAAAKPKKAAAAKKPKAAAKPKKSKAAKPKKTATKKAAAAPAQ